MVKLPSLPRIISGRGSSNHCDKYQSFPYNDRKWPYFLATSAVIYASVLVMILIGRSLMVAASRRRRKNRNVTSMDDELAEADVEFEQGLYLRLKEIAGNLVSAQTVQGRILVVLSFVFNLTACSLYVSESSFPIEHCLDTDDEPLWRVELCLNIFFVVHLGIRFIAANDKLLFWVLDPLTFVDVLTIPSTIVVTVLRRRWLGLLFLRVIYMINFADILQFLNVLHSGSSVEMAEIFGNFFALWLSSAGFVHLLENTGDWWSPINYQNNQTINYFDSTYFLLVTMSTLGYGDIYCKTYLGRLFTMLFICVGLGLFASYIPAIKDYFTSHTRYDKSYKTTPGKRHVIVAGHITEESVASFLKDFLHPDREDNKTTVLFLSPNFPGTRIQTNIQQHSTCAYYFRGTIYNFYDCHRMKVREADAVIILCNKKCVNPDEEDAANITRVISVKNYNEHVRTIVQLMLNKNKAHLLNCPQWNRDIGDDIVCINELKLGFIAQSCNAPGFSTLMANLFAMRSDTISEDIQESEQWKVAYMMGAANEMYTSVLSDSFIGLTFQQAAEICFEKLHLLLIAIEMKKSRTERWFAVNPNDKKLKMVKGTRGFFFAQNASDVARVYHYCAVCHKELLEPEKLEKCKCKKGRMKFEPKRLFQKKRLDETHPQMNEVVLLQGLDEEVAKVTRSLTDDIFPNGDRPKFDQTGTFYWCETRSFQAARLTLEDAINMKFHNHVVVLVLSTKTSPPLGLRQLVFPLRASNNTPASLKKVVILGDGEFLLREWSSLANFPDVDVVVGSCYNRSDLRAVNVNTADMCIVMSPGHGGNNDEHEALADKEVILVTLNLKAMTFDESELAIQEEIVKTQVAQNGSVADVSIILPTNTHNGVESQATEQPQEAVRTVKGSLRGANIPMITELVCDSNAMYLDQEDMNIYDDDGIFLTQPYACGAAFTVSVLDSLVSATYFNKDVLTLVRNLVTGSASPALDELLAEGKVPTGSFETPEIAAVRNRCRVAQISLLEGPLAEFGECGLFGDLFLYALRSFSMICLGLYRFRDSQRANSGIPSSKRYVITFPKFNFVLAPTDLVFVLMQFDRTRRRRRVSNKNASTLSRLSTRSAVSTMY